MKRSQLAHLIRAAAEITGQRDIIVVGSQAILGSVSEERLPDAAWESVEADFVLAVTPNAEAAEAALGQDSRFHRTYGIWADVVSAETAKLPRGWRRRLVRFGNAETAPASALCLERHDLAISKLVAHRGKDLAFVTALLDAGLLSLPTLTARARFIDGAADAEVDRVRAWIEARRRAN